MEDVGVHFTQRERKKARTDGPKPDTPGKGKSKASTDATTTTAPFDDPTADLVLVSADEKPFRVHKYYLQAHSSVFRDMIDDAVLSTTASADKTTTICLADPEIETAEVLSLFLSTICAPTGNAFQTELENSGFSPDTLADKAVQLAVKYDCPLLIREMLKAVRIRIMTVSSRNIGHIALVREKRIDMPHTFAVAAENNLADECAALIALGGRADPHAVGKRVDSPCPLDTGDMSLAQARRIPFEYFWALQGAWTITARRPLSGARREVGPALWMRASEQFLRLLETSKGRTDESIIHLPEPGERRKTRLDVDSDIDYDLYEDYTGEEYDEDYY